MNMSLLCKWWWKLEHEEGLWQEIVKTEYLHNKSIFCVTHKNTNSQIWSDLLKVRGTYLQGRSIRTMNGKKTRFQNDPWLYENTVYTIVPTLFILCEQREGIVGVVKSGEIQITLEDG